MKPIKLSITLVAFLMLLGNPIFAQKAVLDAIKKETSEENIMRNLSYFSDVHGPRLFGTPNYHNAILHAEKELKEAGVKVWLENFDQNYRGWGFTSFSVEMKTPKYAPLSVYPLAHTKSTKGEQEGELVFIDRFKDVYEMKGKLKGKIIIYRGYYRPVKNVENPTFSRLSKEELNRAAANPDPNDVIIGYHGRTSVPLVLEYRENTKKRMTEFFTYLEKEGVIAAIEPSDYPYGILHADGNRSVPSFKLKNDLKPIASFVMANEHFGRLLRLHNLGLKPKLKVELTSKYYEEPKYHNNLIAEIPGTDPKLKDELVIMGGHFDSWHAATGAADNATNCALMMESIRVLKKLNLKNKRTIRLVFWGGHEQVYCGSQSYINNRVADLATGKAKDEKDKISAYLNLDNGAGKIRGIYLMGNEKVDPYFAEYLQPFEGSNTRTIQNANQTDHWLFDYLNIPAFQLIQDPLEYIAMIHHTNLDVLEYVPPADQKFNAELMAYLALQIANEKHKLPRKPYNFVKPSKKGSTTISLTGHTDAKNVSVVSDFNNWDMFNVPMYKTEKGWEVKLDLPKGKYYYKFIVDGWWTNDPETPKEKYAKDGKGHGGLTILYVE